MSEDKLANINGEELRKEIEILFEDKERRVFFMQMLATSVKETNELLNVVTLVLHSIGMSPNVRKKRTYDDLDYDMLEKTLDISADYAKGF